MPGAFFAGLLAAPEGSALKNVPAKSIAVRMVRFFMTFHVTFREGGSAVDLAAFL
jgi:hypothetical protein